MTPNPIGILNGQGGEILIEIIKDHGGVQVFPKNSSRPLLETLERLADDGYLEALVETPDTITYTLIV